MFELVFFVVLLTVLIGALGMPYPDITYGRGTRH